MHTLGNFGELLYLFPANSLQIPCKLPANNESKMATTNFFIDKRRARKDGTFPLKLNLSHNGRSALISLGVYVLPEQWDGVRCKIKGLPNAAALNSFIKQRKLDIDGELLAMAQEGVGMASMGAVQLRDCAMERAGMGNANKAEGCYVEQGQDAGLFASWFLKFTASKRGRTREIYEATYKRMKAFAGDGLDGLSFEGVDRKWLVDFENFLARTSPSQNARNIHLRNIRAVFNDALDEEATSAYPFRRFKIRGVATPKRSLTVEQLRELWAWPVEGHAVKYLDMFKLTFLLVGINVVDLCGLKEVRGGRVEYRRSKTGRLYDIKVEPEAMEIIERHRGKRGFLLDAMDTYNNYRDYAKRLNENLQRIGEVKRVGRGGRKVFTPAFPGLTTYWARHSWATVAASLDIPKETIAHALGHGGNTVTDIYIDFDQRKVDEANRRVIDWVLYGKR